jgi:hypothetical protein
MKFLNLIIICILISSCNNKTKKQEIQEFDKIRMKVGLINFSNEYKLDSTLNIFIEKDEWKFIDYDNFIEFANIRKKHNNLELAIAEYYSNIDKSKHKIILFKKDKNGKLNLISEEDRYIKRVNKNIDIIVNLNYNFLINESYYTVDSLPTKKLIQDNKTQLKKIIEEGKKINAYLCGTAVNEILENEFPKRYTIINKDLFEKLTNQIRK